MDAIEDHARKQRNVDSPKNGENFTFPIEDGTVKLPGWDEVLRTPTLILDSLDRGEEQGHLLGKWGFSPPFQDSSLDDSESRSDFCSIPSVKLFVPRDESVPIPLRYSDVTRATRAMLGVMLERRMDDCWNIDGDRDLSDSRTGFTRFTIFNENAQMGKHGLGRSWRRNKRHPGLITCGERDGKTCPEAAVREEKQSGRAIEKPKLDSAGRLRGIYYIDPADEEFKETVRNGRRKLEVPMPAAMPWRLGKERTRKLAANLILRD